MHRLTSPLLLAICEKFGVNLFHSEILSGRSRGEASPPVQHSTAHLLPICSIPCPPPFCYSHSDFPNVCMSPMLLIASSYSLTLLPKLLHKTPFLLLLLWLLQLLFLAPPYTFSWPISIWPQLLLPFSTCYWRPVGEQHSHLPSNQWANLQPRLTTEWQNSSVSMCRQKLLNATLLNLRCLQSAWTTSSEGQTQ